MTLFKKKPKQLPLHAQKIEDYALIGDCETAALVSRTGSIDWLCWPSFSSDACFAALLGTAEHGYWKIAPVRAVKSVRRRYLPDSLVVETIFETDKGSVALIDFMPPRGEHSDVVRIVRGLSGRVEMRMEMVLRFDYGLSIPWVTRIDGGIRAVSGPHMAVLRTSAKLKGEAEEMATVSEFTLREGGEEWFTLTYASSIGKDGGSDVDDPRPIHAHDAFDDTMNFWQEWNGRNTYRGRYAAQVCRSLMALKAMTYRPSGGIVAAVTTSLPEQMGGTRNWDYRYCWLRDTAFTLQVLLHAGYEDEAVAWRRWLLRAVAGAPTQVQTMYGICGDRQLNEWNVEWLPGYENSKPVRVGNAASTQFQLDVYGEVVSALLRIPSPEDIKVSAASVQTQLVEHVCRVWDQPDDGIWETRGKRKHFVYSKVMAWVALDRAIRHHEAFDGGDVKRWKKNRDLLHKEICAKGFNKRLNSFTQSYGSKALDASCLRLGLVGFLPMDDPRIVGTVNAIEKHLMKDGFVQRYDTGGSSDGLPPGEGAFLACSFWMVACLWLLGRHADAEAMFERLLGLCNDVGLISEEWDPKGRRMTGNFPQALSHIAMVQAAFTISGAWKPERVERASSR